MALGCDIKVFVVENGRLTVHFETDVSDFPAAHRMLYINKEDPLSETSRNRFLLLVRTPPIRIWSQSPEISRVLEVTNEEADLLEVKKSDGGSLLDDCDVLNSVAQQLAFVNRHGLKMMEEDEDRMTDLLIELSNSDDPHESYTLVISKVYGGYFHNPPEVFFLSSEDNN